MGFTKKAVALAMAAVLLMSSVTAMATEDMPAETEPQEEQKEEEIFEENQVQFKIGEKTYTVVNADAGLPEDGECVYFEEDGSYTIGLPVEPAAVFPYSVEFILNGISDVRTFNSADDAAEVGGHIFRVSVPDGGISPASLLPLPEKEATVVLTGLTPVELTKVPIKKKLEEQGLDLSGASKIAWAPRYGSHDYTVSGIDDSIDLSYGTFNSSPSQWEMIIGDGNQLNPDNIRCFVEISTTPSSEWLAPQVYAQDAQGKRIPVTIGEYDYEAGSNEHSLEIDIASNTAENKDLYFSLAIDKSQFPQSNISYVKYAEGYYNKESEAVEALGAHDVTNQVMCADMASASAGYQTDGNGDVELTMVAYDSSGTVIGWLPFKTRIYRMVEYVLASLYGDEGQLGDRYVYSDDRELSFSLREPHKLDGNYKLVLDYHNWGSTQDITSVYVGKYESDAQARAAGAKNIKDTIYGSSNAGKGYSADFSQGVDFTVFAGEEVYSFCVKTVRADQSEYKSSATYLDFWQLVDEDGKSVNVYTISEQNDSYAEQNYITMLVPDEVDLSKKYAPVFTAPDKAKVYAAGASAPEESGKTYHLLNAPIQYTVNAENGVDVKNYWLQVKKVNSVEYGSLYINSLIDDSAKTTVKDGIVYSTREMMVDSYHDDHHDICFANIGQKELADLSAVLESDVVEIDPYWTFKGGRSLAGMSTVERPAYDSGLSGELPNLAKVRLRKKEGVKDGTDITGTLTIKSGGTALMVLALTGMVGDPCITTEEISNAVKYVPYGTVIQNSNKYSWIQPEYELTGELPEGMELRPNGELYGVPQETGSFDIKVTVSFKSTRNMSFPRKSAEFTLDVIENTDEDVYFQSDEDGYNLLTPIGVESGEETFHFILAKAEDSLFVSEGPMDHFIDLWLNGKKLQRGEDYKVESGSTRITVISQTMQNQVNKNGRNTIAAEFRVNGDVNENLKRTAQNFYMDSTNPAPNPNPKPNKPGTGSDGENNSTGTPGGNSNSGNSGGNVNASGTGSASPSPSTGDNLDPGVWLSVMLLSLAVLAGTAFFYKKDSSRRI